MLAGIEHEYRVMGPDGAVRFARLVHTLGLGVRHLDPLDPNAYRLPSGTAVTADGAEAEIALAPVPLSDAASLAERADSERSRLQSLLPSGLSLAGYSTHINVQSDQDRSHDLLRTFPTLLTALIGWGEGLICRPRPGRLELCGEFLDGPGLTRAVRLFAGCLWALESETAPPASDVDVERSGQRGGWALRRSAVSPDASRLRLERSIAHRSIRGRPLAAPTAPFESALAPPPRAFEMAPVLVSWDLIVYLVGRGRRRAYACVPRAELAAFVRGDHDRQVLAHLRRPLRRGRLARPAQAAAFGVFAALGPRRDLLPA